MDRKGDCPLMFYLNDTPTPRVSGNPELWCVTSFSNLKASRIRHEARGPSPIMSVRGTVLVLNVSLIYQSVGNTCM